MKRLLLSILAVFFIFTLGCQGKYVYWDTHNRIDHLEDAVFGDKSTPVEKPQVSQPGLGNLEALMKLMEKSGAAKARAFNALTGGGALALDSIAQANITDLAIAWVIVSEGLYFYQYDAASTDAENSPYRIRPDDYDTGVWHLIDTFYIHPTANPKTIWRDSNAGDYDDNVYLSINCPETGSGAEDCQIDLYVQIDGTATRVASWPRDGSTGPGYQDFYEDSDNGDNYVRLIGPASTADVTQTLQAVTGTIYSTGGIDVTVADGGTGASSHTDGGIVTGNAGNALNTMAVLADAEIIVGDGTTEPTAVVPVMTEFIPVGWMVADGTTDPGDLTEEDNIAYRDFADDSTEELEFMWHSPFNISGSTIKIQVINVITNATPPANTEGVSWNIAACSITGDESHDCAVGADAEPEDTDLDDHASAQWDIIYLGSEAVDDPDAANGFVTLTPTGLDNGELVKITIARDHDDAIDDYAQDIGLIGIIIKYKIDFATETF